MFYAVGYIDKFGESKMKKDELIKIKRALKKIKEKGTIGRCNLVFSFYDKSKYIAAFHLTLTNDGLSLRLNNDYFRETFSDTWKPNSENPATQYLASIERFNTKLLLDRFKQKNEKKIKDLNLKITPVIGKVSKTILFLGFKKNEILGYDVIVSEANLTKFINLMKEIGEIKEKDRMAVEASF